MAREQDTTPSFIVRLGPEHHSSFNNEPGSYAPTNAATQSQRDLSINNLSPPVLAINQQTSTHISDKPSADVSSYHEDYPSVQTTPPTELLELEEDLGTSPHDTLSTNVVPTFGVKRKTAGLKLQDVNLLRIGCHFEYSGVPPMPSEMELEIQDMLSAGVEVDLMTEASSA